MCGFAGFLWPHAPRDTQHLAGIAEAMAARLAHRGPDGSGVWVDADAGLALGHRRLAVLDRSPAGHQPMRSACGRHMLVFNGEIYNHQELRAALRADGYDTPWRGHGDTETLLAALARWGLEETLARCVGMFALAWWDQRDRVLRLARDRLGEKPLYYGWQGGALLFASEVGALRAHPAWRGEIDRDALALYLRHNYVPAPRAIYRGIHKLPPGCHVTVGWGAAGPEPGHLAPPVHYWSVQAAAEAGRARPFQGDAEAATEALETLLRQSVRGQMHADVPLGAFLSGGIDSSLVAALMRAEASQPVHTFTIGFEDPAFDESAEARAVARHLGCRHTEWIITPRQALDIVPTLADRYDEPFADSSQIPTLLLTRLCRQSVTVALSGDGGDELFGGYERYFWGQRLWRHARALPPWARRLTRRAITALPTATADRLHAALAPLLPRAWRVARPGHKLRRASTLLLADDPARLYHGLITHWERPDELVIDGHEPDTALRRAEYLARHWPMTEMMMLLDSERYLPDDLLVKVDRAAMAASLETRAPLLDHRVLEFAWRLPTAMKLKDDIGKIALRRVLRRHLPPALFERPKKGFGVPLAAWLRGPLRDWAEHLLDAKRMRHQGYLRPEPVRALWRCHLRGTCEGHYLLWDVLMFQAWLESHHVDPPLPR